MTIYTMRAFDLIFAMTQGGPLDSSNVLPLLSYQFSFQQFQFGIGAAVGTFAFVIVFARGAALCAHAAREERLMSDAPSPSRLAPSRLATAASASLGVALYLFPIYWMFISGLKTSAEIFANPPTLVPARIRRSMLSIRVRARERRCATCATAWRSRFR